jgi:hypothetical protein
VYAFQMDVEQPVEMYEQVHAEVERVTGQGLPEHCLLHMATRTPTGFRVTEVWDSHEAADRFGDEVVRPAIERIAGAQATAEGPPPSTELDVVGLETGRRLTNA